jgi:hypothetical protein
MDRGNSFCSYVVSPMSSSASVLLGSLRKIVNMHIKEELQWMSKWKYRLRRRYCNSASQSTSPMPMLKFPLLSVPSLVLTFVFLLCRYITPPKTSEAEEGLPQKLTWGAKRVYAVGCPPTRLRRGGSSLSSMHCQKPVTWVLNLWALFCNVLKFLLYHWFKFQFVLFSSSHSSPTSE